MINPREFLYINTFLDKEERGIWTSYFYKGYEVAIKRRGKYILDFQDEQKLTTFIENIVGKEDVELVINQNKLTIYKKDSNKVICIKCASKVLADELTKKFREQWVQRRKHLKKEVFKEAGLKF